MTPGSGESWAMPCGNAPQTPSGMPAVTGWRSCWDSGKDTDGFQLLQKDSRLRAELQNNGRAPEKPLTEHGGLKSLRQMTEAFGGSMKIAYTPAFRVILELPEQSR